MKKRTKRLIGALALLAGAVGAAGAFMSRRRSSPTYPPQKHHTDGREKLNVWARPGMSVTFRAELMPGVEASSRTYEVSKLLPSGRVMLNSLAGEHAENEFEPLRR
ncbi:MAG: hypothetical protein WKF84_07935 [Pyrinomonadaceae bacterium]